MRLSREVLLDIFNLTKGIFWQNVSEWIFDFPIRQKIGLNNIKIYIAFFKMCSSKYDKTGSY